MIAVETMTNVVKLNVGGTVFITTRRTLTANEYDRDNTLRKILKTAPHDLYEGAIFIDRPSAHFGVILDYLRTGYIGVNLSPHEINALLVECDYYCLHNLACRLQGMCKMKCFDVLIKFNVNGTIFLVPKRLLNTSSFKPDCTCFWISEDEIFITQPPNIFKYIVTYINGENVIIDEISDVEYKSLVCMCRAYGLHDMVDRLQFK